MCSSSSKTTNTHFQISMLYELYDVYQNISICLFIYMIIYMDKKTGYTLRRRRRLLSVTAAFKASFAKRSQVLKSEDLSLRSFVPGDHRGITGFQRWM